MTRVVLRTAHDTWCLAPDVVWPISQVEDFHDVNWSPAKPRALE